MTVRRPGPLCRPGPLRWLWYAMGGRLPLQYRAWVLHDVSCDTWRLRQFVRAFVQMSPMAVPILLLMPGQLWVRIAAIALGWLVGLQYALYFAEGAVERRAWTAGYTPDEIQAARDGLHADERAAAAARYAARWRGGKI